MSRPAQKVRHGVFVPLEVREKRDKRGKSPLPLPLELRDKRDKRDKPISPSPFRAVRALSLVANEQLFRQPPHYAEQIEWVSVWTSRDRKSTRLNSSHLGI